jgi:hypothetical protein
MIKNIIKSLVGQASTIIDDVVTTDEERLKLKNEFEKVIQEHEKEMFALEVGYHLYLCLFSYILLYVQVFYNKYFRTFRLRDRFY